MKKSLILIAAVFGIATFSCTDKEKSDSASGAAANETSPELNSAIAQRDSLLTLVSDIWGEMEHIKRLEDILTVNSGDYDKMPGKRSQILRDIASIQQTLQQRREKLAELEAKLDLTNESNRSLTNTIATLRKEIDSQTQIISALNSQLGAANMKIDSLGAHVDSLNVTIADVTAAKDEAEQMSTELTNELNECYYAVGSNSELKAHKILESGFLKKTKILKGEFDKSFFTTGDKRTLTSIDLYSKKAEVLTGQPKDSYEIVEANGHKVLRITNPTKFWELTNFLVIKIN